MDTNETIGDPTNPILQFPSPGSIMGVDMINGPDCISLPIQLQNGFIING